MNEKKIQGRLKKTITAVAATGGILLAAAGFFGSFLLWMVVLYAVFRKEQGGRVLRSALDIISENLNENTALYREKR